MSLLDVRNLTVRIGKGGASILDDVSVRIAEGETLGLVGESGSGKSTLGMAILRLTPHLLGHGTSGEVFWKGRDLLKAPNREMRRLRGREISMVLQDPMASLNPVQSIGVQLREALTHAGRPASAAEQALAEVNIPSPAERLKSYPHQMSGGMRQRVVGAIGIAQEPKLLICDEPTTSLDATIQYQYLELLARLRDAHGMSMLFVTHDFGVVAKICDSVAVMYAGRIVERGPVREVFRAPKHRYTEALLASVPSTTARPDRLPAIPGQPPAVGRRPSGCPFRPRCAAATAQCETQPPEEDMGPNHTASCWHPAGSDA